MQHSDFAVLTVSWELALRADGYADNTVKAYQNAVRSLADWLAEHHPQVGPAQLERQHIRGWLVEVRERHSSNTTRGWFAGSGTFCRWPQSEGEADQDATAGIRTPAPGDPETPVLSDADRGRPTLDADGVGDAQAPGRRRCWAAGAAGRCPTATARRQPQIGLPKPIDVCRWATASD